MKWRILPSLPWLAALVLSSATLTRAQEPASANEPPTEHLSQEALAINLMDVTAEGDMPSSLAERRGPGGLLVIFLSNTCPYVLDWADRLPKLEAQAKEQGIGVALVNSNAAKRRASDSAEDMRRFAGEYLGEQPYFLDQDSELADALGAERTPEALLFDTELQLIYRGPIDDHSGPFEKVEEHWLQDALSSIGTDLVAPDSRPALGCKVLRPRRRSRAPAGQGH